MLLLFRCIVKILQDAVPLVLTVSCSVASCSHLPLHPRTPSRSCRTRPSSASSRCTSTSRASCSSCFTPTLGARQKKTLKEPPTRCEPDAWCAMTAVSRYLTGRGSAAGAALSSLAFSSLSCSYCCCFCWTSCRTAATRVSHVAGRSKAEAILRISIKPFCSRLSLLLFATLAAYVCLGLFTTTSIKLQSISSTDLSLGSQNFEEKLQLGQSCGFTFLEPFLFFFTLRFQRYNHNSYTE